MIISNLCRSRIGICAIAGILAGCAAQNAPALGVSEATSQRANTSSYTIVYRFAHRAFPHAGLIDVKGTFYGTTTVGGSSGNGYVYSVTAGGAEKTLHDFKGGADGAQPEAGLIEVDGTLYGTTYAGGGKGCSDGEGCGTVYGISTTGDEKVLHSFTDSPDGAHPQAGLVDAGGTLYGTTYQGGSGKCTFQGHVHGCGTVYSITGSGNESVLYSFSGGSDGWCPKANLIDVNGSLYGTTYLGGSDAEGTVFRISTSGVKKVLHSFGAGTDGTNPLAPLIDVKGTLYGTTSRGGESNYGAVFSMRKTGAESTVHSFTGSPDGGDPFAGLIGINGTLFGTTAAGGASGNGTVYTVSTTGAERVVYSFTGGADGSSPQAGLIDVKGTLYGTTAGGGSGHGFGTVYALSP